MNKLKLSHPLISFSGTLLLAVVAFVSGVGAMDMISTPESTANTASVAEAFPPPLVLSPDKLLAKAAVLYDPQSGRILYAKNSEEQLPLASLTKLMTATAVLRNSSLNSSVNITAADLQPEGDWGFHVGDVIPLSDLLKMSLIASSNDAMAAAAASLGSNYMHTVNETAKDLGLSDMYFLNPTGLDVSTSTAGAYGSAYDVARLASMFFKQYPHYFGLTTKQDVQVQDGDRTLWAGATATPLDHIPGLIGAKTGYTDLAGGNLVAVFDVEIGHPLVAVVLGSTEEGRFNDIATLIRTVRQQTSTL